MATLKNLEYIQYNKQEYRQILKVYSLYEVKNSWSNQNGKLNIIDKDNIKYTTVLYNDYISEIELMNDIVNPVLTAKIKFNDLGDYVVNKLASNGTSFIEILLEKINKNSSTGVDEVEFSFNHLFIISKIDIISKEQNVTSYEISLISSNLFHFNNNLKYSSKGPKTHSSIIKEMIEKSGLKYSNNRKLLINNESIYITPSDYCLLNNLDYLINSYVDSGTGLCFLVYDHLDNSYDLLSFKNEIIKIKDGTSTLLKENNLFYSSKDNIVNPMIMIHNVTCNNYNNISVFDLQKEVVFNNFSYSSRTWSKTVFENSDIKQTLCSPQSYEYDLIVKPLQFVSPDVNAPKKEYWFRNDSEFSKELKKLFLHSNTLEFNCIGFFKRNVGQLINVVIDKDLPMGNRYGGYWNVIRIYHNFTNSLFKQTLQCARLDEVK